MSATGTETVSLNLDGSFAAEAAKAAAAGEKLSGALGDVDAAAAKAAEGIKAAAKAAREAQTAAAKGLALQTNNGSFTSRTRSSSLDDVSPWARYAEAQKKAAATSAKAKAEMGKPVPGGAGEGGAGGSPKDLKYLLKTAGIGKAAQAAIGAASSVELAKLAMGYRGMAQLQALGMRAQMQFRQLFAGVNPAPVIRAFNQFTQLVNGNSAAGKALAGIFSRVFNGLFGAVEKVEPLLSMIAKMAIVAAQGMEIAWLRARVALLPVTTALANAGIEIDGIGLAAQMAAAPFQVLGAYAETLGKGITLAYEAAVKLNSALGGLPAAALSKIPDAARAVGSVYNAAGSAAMAPIRGGVEAAKGLFGGQPAPPAGASPKPDAANAQAAGYATGAAYPAGVAAGVTAGTPAVGAAGQALMGALDKSVRAAGQIHSPSKLAEDTASEYPAGAVKGVKGGAADVQAAGAALVPNMGGAGGGGRGLGAGVLAVTITHQWGGERPKDARAYEKAAELGDLAALRVIAQQLGVSLEVAA